MGIGSLRSSIRSGLDTFSSKCENLVGGTKKRISHLLGGIFLATTLATTSPVAMAEELDTSKIDTDSSSWSIAYNGPNTAGSNISEVIENITFDTIMAPIVLKSTKSEKENIETSEKIFLDRAPSYDSDIFTNNPIRLGIENFPSNIQETIEKNAGSYPKKTNLESKLSGLLHKDYKQEAVRIKLQNIKIDIHTVRSSEGNKSKNQVLAQNISQNVEEIIHDTFSKNLPSVRLTTESSGEVYTLAKVEKEFLHQTAQKYNLSEYHLIQGYNNRKLPLDPYESTNMKKIFDEHRHLALSGNAQYMRTDTHNTPLPIGAFGLFFGGILGLKKLVKKKSDIQEGLKKGIGKIQGFLRNSFRVFSGIFSSKEPVETVADRMGLNIKQMGKELEEHKKFNPDERSNITDIEGVSMGILSFDAGIFPNILSPQEDNDYDTTLSDREKINSVSDSSAGKKYIPIVLKAPDNALDQFPKIGTSFDKSYAPSTAEISPGIQEKRKKYPHLRACINKLDLIKDEIIQSMYVKDKSKIEKYIGLYRQLLISRQWSESKIFLESIISDFQLSEDHLLVIFKKELVDTCKVQSDFPPERIMSTKTAYIKRVYMMKSGKIFTSKERINLKIGKNRGEAEILYISDTHIQVVFHRKNLPTEKYTLSRRDFEAYLEAEELDVIFEKYRNSNQISIIARGMYQDSKFAPKKEVTLDDGSIFYITERLSISGMTGVTEYCGMYTMVGDILEGWVFMKGQDGKWRCMPHADKDGPQNYFASTKGTKTVSLREHLKEAIETIPLSSDPLILMDIIRPLYPINKASSSSDLVKNQPAYFLEK